MKGFDLENRLGIEFILLASSFWLHTQYYVLYTILLISFAPSYFYLRHVQEPGVKMTKQPRSCTEYTSIVPHSRQRVHSMANTDPLSYFRT